MNSFSDVESVWSDRLGNLRNVVRQQVIHRQLTDHTETARNALDVGCGQGTQATLEQLSDNAQERGVTVESLQGTLGDLDRLVGANTYDLVMAHGLLMYLTDPKAAVSALATRVAAGGTLSITFRNGAALAYRLGLRRQWQRALAAFDEMTYVNELGADARAHTLDEVTARSGPPRIGSRRPPTQRSPCSDLLMIPG